MNYLFGGGTKEEQDEVIQEIISTDKNAWKLHDTYPPGVSSSRIVTRSQTGFNRIENTKENLDLFADPDRHVIPGRPHLIEVMKGRFGSIPRTIVTRSTGQHLKKSQELEAKLTQYKNYHAPTKAESEEKMH